MVQSHHEAACKPPKTVTAWVPPWPAMMAGHGRPWPAMTCHGRPWPAITDSSWEEGSVGKPRKVASLRAQGALGAFGPLKKVASLRDPCPESPKMVGYTFDFMAGKVLNGRLRRPFWEVLGMK